MKNIDKMIEDNLHLIFEHIKKCHYEDSRYYEDIVQEGLIGLWEGCSNFNQDRGNLRTWLKIQ